MMPKVRYVTVTLACMLLAASAVNAQDSVAKLVDALSSADAQARIDACEGLAELGPRALAAVPQLTGVLKKEKSPDVLRGATLAVAAIGPGAKAAIPALVANLQSENPKIRAYTAYALGHLGAAAQSAAPDLIKLATDKDPSVRRKVRDALRMIDAPRELTLPLYVKLLKEASPQDASAAVLTLAELGAEAVPNLCAALDHKEAGYWACLALGEIGPEAAAAVPHLAPLLKSDEPEIRLQALVTLGKIGPAAKELIPQITTLLDTDDFEGVRYAAAFALGSIGEKGAGIKELEKALDNKDDVLRVASAWAYLRLVDEPGSVLDEAIKNVMAAFESENPDVRDLAANALADPDITQELVGDALRKALERIEEKDVNQLKRIADTLATLGPKIVPACIQSLEKERKLRFYALRILIQVGPNAAPAVPALIKTLDDPDPVLRREAEFALGAIGPGAADATSKLVEKLTDEVEDVRHTACYALGKIGSDAVAALPALAKAMRSDDEFLVLASAWAALNVAPENPRLQRLAQPILIKGLNDKREHVRVEAIYLLCQFGDASAIAAVKALANDSSAAVRAAVTEALADKNK